MLRVDAADNRIVVGSGEELASREARLEAVRFPSGPRTAPFRAGARVRHRAPEAPCIVTPEEGGRARVLFDAPVRAVAPGQSCVFYEGETVIGGGVLVETAPDAAAAPRPEPAVEPARQFA